MKQIGTEVMSDWPVNAYTLREILHDLGFKESREGEFVFTGNPELLDSYPITLEDDGMGYGIKEQFIVESDSFIYTDEKSGLNVFNLFRDGYRQTD